MELRPGYKQTEVGVIPEDWRTASLASLCVEAGLVRGPFGGSLKKEFFVRAGYKVYEQRNAIYRDAEIGSYFIDQAKFADLKRFEVLAGDFIVSCSGTIGRIFQIPNGARAGVINQALLKIRIDSVLADRAYFYHYFDWDRFQQRIVDNTQGGAMQNLVGMDVFRNIPIPLPPFPEQRAIAAALSDVDALLASLDALIAKKRDLKQAAMQQLLSGRQRLPGFSGEKAGYKQTEVGVIPQDWHLFQIPKLTTGAFDGIKIGPFGSQLKKEYLTKSGYRVYGQENIFERNMSIGDRFIDGDHFRALKSCELVRGDFIISMMGTVGKCLIVPEGIEPGIMDSHLLRLRLDNTKVCPELLLHIFGSRIILDQIKRLSVGGIMEGLSSSIIKRVSIALPPVNEQSAIAAVLSDMDAEIVALEARRDKTRALKQGMMQELLTGRIRLL